MYKEKYIRQHLYPVKGTIFSRHLAEVRVYLEIKLGHQEVVLRLVSAHDRPYKIEVKNKDCSFLLDREFEVVCW